jgi:hypothetical protein
VNAIQRKILRRLIKLGESKTMCPGRLARDCGTDLKSVRSDLISLEADGEIVISQRGQPVSGSLLKGPFRVRLS